MSEKEEESLRIQMAATRRFAVVVPAGDSSLHYSCGWFSEDRTYDLGVAYYGSDDAVAER